MSAIQRYLATCVCFFLSGLAALVYQIAWTRQFALVFGTSELAVATVLAAYMAGLALGARLIERVLPRISNPVRWYAWFEGGIAVTAVIWVPLCLWLAEKLLVGMLGGQSEPPSSLHASTSLFYLVAAFITLLIPTALMGATLPLLVRDGVHDEQQVGRRVGFLYVCNTAGAVLGALLASLVLLPQLGLRATVWTAAAVNVLVAVAALTVLKQSAVVAAADGPPANDEVEDLLPAQMTEPLSHAQLILPLMMLSGAVSFLHEVLWTRLLAHVMGGSIIAFGVMVASFLLGIALGGAVGAWCAKRAWHAVRAWVAAQGLVALMAVLAWYVLPHAPMTDSLWLRVAFGLCVLLPLTTAIGATYPLAVRMLVHSAEQAASASARVYAWNTVGAIVGALAGGFWLIPWLRYEGSVRLTVWLSVALALIAVGCWLRSSRVWLIPSALTALLIVVAFQPATPDAVLRLSPLRAGTGELVYYAVGRGADVVVLRDDHSLDLRTNGLPEAGIDVVGAAPSLNVEAWMSPLAVLARPATQSMLVVGFGGGNVVQAIPPTVKSIDVIELEPQVIAANQALSSQRARDPLYDSRVNVILNDARGALLLTDKHYDAVVSQPSHPWTAGASHLYTREFMHQVHEHLTTGGVFVQWLSADFMDESLLRSLLATLSSEYVEVRLYRPSPSTLLFMASDLPLQPERNWQTTQAMLRASSAHYGRVGINAVEDMLAALALDESGVKALAANQPLITDDDNRLATSGVYDFKRAMKSDRAGQLLLQYDPLTRPENNLLVELANRVRLDYLWRRLDLWSSTDSASVTRMQRISSMVGDSEAASVLSVLAAQRQHAGTADIEQLVRGALQRWPSSQTLRYTWLEPHINELVAGKPAAEVQQAYQQLSGEPLLVIDALKLAMQENWPALKELDTQLGQVAWTSPWYGQAAQLRAEWRARVGNRELRLRYGPEAIAIADRMLLTQPDGFWYALRALNSVNADQPLVMLESIASFAQLALDRAQALSPAERALARQRAAQLQGLLDSLSREPQVSAKHFNEVNERLQRAKSALG